MLRGLKPSPDDRFESLEPLIEALEDYGRGRTRRLALVGVAAAALLMGSAGVWASSRSEPPSLEEATAIADPDGDRILGSADKCPNAAEDVDGFEDADGCPDADNDQDGVLDGADDCPNDPEDIDGVQDADGCPERDWSACDIEFENRIYFKSGSAKIDPRTRPLLRDIAARMAESPESKFEIGGHSDEREPGPRGAEGAKELAQRRADAVAQAIRELGIAGQRLTTVSYGQTLPIDSNKKAEGRARNRRVELVNTSCANRAEPTLKDPFAETGKPPRLSELVRRDPFLEPIYARLARRLDQLDSKNLDATCSFQPMYFRENGKLPGTEMLALEYNAACLQQHPGACSLRVGTASNGTPESDIRRTESYGRMIRKELVARGGKNIRLNVVGLGSLEANHAGNERAMDQVATIRCPS